jgi:hypothetical protein
LLILYVPDPRSRGATQIHHLEHRTLPAQGKCALPCLSSSTRKDEQRTAPEWPRIPLTRESRATNEHTILPQSPFSFSICNRKSNARASRLSHLWPLFAVQGSLVVLLYRARCGPLPIALVIVFL